MGELVREIEGKDPAQLLRAFSGTPWEYRGVAHFEQLAAEHRRGSRLVLVALSDGLPVAHVSLLWESDYPPFRRAGIPEVHDLAVSPDFRRRGIGTALLDHAEGRASGSTSVVGAAVGLHPGYGSAQRLYVRRGYVPDGAGAVRRNRVVPEGEATVLDDETVLFLKKSLG